MTVGLTVRIFALRPQQQLHVGRLAVDLVMGLEKPLIDLANPEWNRQR